LVGWVRWNPDVLIAALQNENFKLNQAMAESIVKSDLNDYTDEKKLEVYYSLMLSVGHNDGGLVSDTEIINMTLEKIIEQEVFEERDEKGWQEFLESAEIKTENVP